MKGAPIDSPGTIHVVERYHVPLRAAFEKIKKDHGTNIPDNECLTMAV